MAISITHIPGVTNFVDRRHNLQKHSTKQYETRKLDQIKYIVIHHAASSDSATPDSIAKGHVEDNAWPGIGYHFVIERDGKVSWVNSLETISYHCGNNTPSLGISLIGDFEDRNYTQAQWDAALAVARYLSGIVNVGVSGVYGHKEVPNGSPTKCPGKNFNMDQFRKDFSRGLASGSTYNASSVNLSQRLSSATYMSGWVGTAYYPPAGGINGEGDYKTTASGTTWTAYRSMAVDPERIPYGSVVHVYVPSKPHYSGIYLAEDTGGAIKSENGGKRVDLGLGSLSEAMDFGRVQVEVAILERGKDRATAREKAKVWSQVLANLGVGSSSSNVPTGDQLTEVGLELDALHHPSMMRGMPPNVEDDTYPNHRYHTELYTLRIGDAQFHLPPTSIHTTKVTMVDSKQLIRHKGPIATKSGHTVNQLDIRLVFADVDQINGYPVPAPGGKDYYMDGLRALLAQFYRNPMLPIRNELINDRHGIFNVALKEIFMQTDPDIPNLIVVDLSLLECTMEPYFALPDFMYDLMINYPVWRWYYQQMIFDEKKYRRSSTYLRPINKHMSGETYFRTLEPDFIEQMKADVIQKAQQASDNLDQNTYVNPEYALSNFRLDDIRELMSEWYVENIITSNVRVQIVKEMAPIRLDSHEIPCFQDMGGIDRYFVMEFMALDRDALESLQSMVTHVEATARDYRQNFVGGFIEIHNEIVNLAGIEFAMIMDIATETVESQDDLYKITMTFKEFNPSQKNQERLDGMNYQMTRLSDEFSKVEHTVHKTNQRPTVMYEAEIEKILSHAELYPDLELPTHAEINISLKYINDFRVRNGQSELPYTEVPRGESDRYVEPDFYMVYPDVEDAYRAINAGDFGGKMVSMLMVGSHEDIHAEYSDFNISASLNALNDSFTDNQNNPYDSTQEIFEVTADLNIRSDIANKEYSTNAFVDWSEDHVIPDVETTVMMMLHDMYKYDCRYRLTRAFPTYLLLFIEEGQWVDGRRLWNNYYAYHAITELSVTKDKDNPVDLAYIILSNVYGTFNYTDKLYDPSESTKVSLWDRAKELFNSLLYHTVTEQMIAENSVLFDQAKLKEGAKVHIRMGYSSNAGNLPIAFNGRIATVNDGPDIEMVCQGDGAELIARPLDTDKNARTPGEPHNAFVKYLTKRTSNYWFGMSEHFEFFNNYESYYGIENFGWVESEAQSAGFWKDIPKTLFIDMPSWMMHKFVGQDNFYVYDVIKNIYYGSIQPKTGVLDYTQEEKNDSVWKRIFPRFNVFDGEKNVRLSTYNKTLWDTGQTLSLFVPEFICAVHPHGFRSTLFFGQPHWPVKYEYRNRAGNDPSDINNYEELYKPYQQLHVYTTGNEIIHNNIQSSSEHIYHIMTGIYLRGSSDTVIEGITVYADRSIIASHQKQMIVDTGVFQDIFGPDYLYNITMKYGVKPFITNSVALGEEGLGILSSTLGSMSGLASSLNMELISGWLESASDFTDISDLNITGTVSEFLEAISLPGEQQALSVSIGALQRSFMRMYGGQLIVFGDPSVKPHDLFSLVDSHVNLGGSAQVGSVTHTMSHHQGFITTIQPDLIVSRTDGRADRNAIIQLATAVGVAAGVIFVRKVALSKAFRTLMKWSAEKSWNGTMKTGRAAEKAIRKRTRTGAKTRTVPTPLFDRIQGALTGENARKVGRNLLNISKRHVVAGIVIGAIQEKFLRWYDKETKYNNCIYIYPLWKLGQPFVAGVRGGMHIIPNYIDPAFNDPLFTGQGGAQYLSPSYTSSGEIIHPLKFKSTVTSHHRSLNPGRPSHNGVDFAPRGYDSKSKALPTQVYCVADGTVVRTVRNHVDAGNYVEVLHDINGQKWMTRYLHLNSISVSTNQQISSGGQIGMMGKTGRVYGNGDPTHLHFEVHKGSQYMKNSSDVEPLAWLRQRGVDA